MHKELTGIPVKKYAKQTNEISNELAVDPVEVTGSKWNKRGVKFSSKEVKKNDRTTRNTFNTAVDKADVSKLAVENNSANYSADKIYPSIEYIISY